MTNEQLIEMARQGLDELLAAEARAEAAEAREERLREALSKYGDHQESCEMRDYAGGVRTCQCGFSALETVETPE